MPRAYQQPDPTKVRVQLNVSVSWAFMQHLDDISERRRVPKAELVRIALENAYPMDDPKDQTRKAGATR